MLFAPCEVLVPEFAESSIAGACVSDRGLDSLFVSAGDSPRLIKNLPFVLERKRLAAAVATLDHQVVVAASVRLDARKWSAGDSSSNT
jgi:hypothetical protein